MGEKINILVGLEDKETIRGILWISNYEHPAYRDLLVESNFTDQFIGLRFDDCAPKKNGREVDGITGATKGSNTVIDIVIETALAKVKSIR